MTSSAEKLLSKMQDSRTNWKRGDLEKLYTGFGFIIKAGSAHDKITHPDYPQLFTTLPRHKKLAIAYVTQAVKLVHWLKALQAAEEKGEADDQ
ncbi:MAG: hypothetical protein SGJ24_08020 [Chloroflexota bacterium]|nr:hypothetical protein [Chloroflexota bacterium]